MYGTILNIQNYAVHDGPGIRTLVFLKGCPLRCAWCCNPESQSGKSQIRHISFRCTSCMECAKLCPTASVSDGTGKVRRNFENCNTCLTKECLDVCNQDAVAFSGKEISTNELIKIIAQDIPFYRNSGGGVTFSGGEPLLQAAFLLEVLQECKKLDIHTAVETCGWAETKIFQRILPFTDLFLYDLKIMDPEQHIRHTGQALDPVIRNLEFLASENASVIIRFPLVPGITDTPQNLESVAEIMHRLDLRHICLEPYHTLGREKYDEHGIEYLLDSLPMYTSSNIQEFHEFFTRKGFLCEIA